MLENLRTISQYASEGNHNPNTVKSWVRRGQLPTVVIAGRTFVMKNAQPTHSVRVPVRQVRQ